MRRIDTTPTKGMSDLITIEADDRCPVSNSSHEYHLKLKRKDDVLELIINFQKGPIGEVGYNGITSESLIEVLIDRTKGFEEGKFACVENAVALKHLQLALDSFISRTNKRVDQGVEGKNINHTA